MDLHFQVSFQVLLQSERAHTVTVVVLKGVDAFNPFRIISKHSGVAWFGSLFM